MVLNTQVASSTEKYLLFIKVQDSRDFMQLEYCKELHNSTLSGDA